MPDVETGCCLGSEGNGVSAGGGRVEPALQIGGKISSQCSIKVETTWARMRRAIRVGLMKEDRQEQSEQSADQVKFIL